MKKWGALWDATRNKHKDHADVQKKEGKRGDGTDHLSPGVTCVGVSLAQMYF